MRALLLLSLAIGCSSSSSDKPTGTPTDPVEVCERLADVCKLDDSRLGVCIEAPANKRPARCKTGEPCLVCQPQH